MPLDGTLVIECRVQPSRAWVDQRSIMVESRLPWWLVLLLGVWVAGLTVWSWPRAQRQVRWGAGLLSLVYLVLLVTALGGDPRIVLG